jgi:beta-lactamase regulating signal transducer with metallopeptidase domain
MNTLEHLFSWVLAASWQASLLAILVLAVQAALGRRLNPRWRHALWLLVLLRLILPTLPESNLSLYRFAPAEPPLHLAAPPPAPAIAPPIPASTTPAPLEIPAPPTDYVSPTLTLLWLTGASALALLTLVVNHRFARHVARAPQITDPALREIFADAKTELAIRRPIRLVESPRVSSPAIMGLFTPTLLLPAGAREKFDPRELRFIFLHELAHLKRGDVLIQVLIALLQIVHWFNPVLWYAFRRLRADREPATDALVLSRTGEAEKERYGLMLIKLLEHFNQRHALPTLVGILEDKDQFKRRFTLIARFTRGAYGWSVLGVVLIAVLAVACLTQSKSTNDAVSSYPVKSDILAATFWKKETAPQSATNAPSNPFYAALPFNDLAHPDAAQIWIPSAWKKAAATGQAPRSACLDRWLKITNPKGTSCYAQWEDFGPECDDDPEYVFGNEPPKFGRDGRNDGIDLSPGAAQFLGLDDKNRSVSWQFVDETAVPPGPWLPSPQRPLLLASAQNGEAFEQAKPDAGPKGAPVRIQIIAIDAPDAAFHGPDAAERALKSYEHFRETQENPGGVNYLWSNNPSVPREIGSAASHTEMGNLAELIGNFPPPCPTVWCIPTPHDGKVSITGTITLNTEEWSGTETQRKLTIKPVPGASYPINLDLNFQQFQPVSAEGVLEPAAAQAANDKVPRRLFVFLSAWPESPAEAAAGQSPAPAPPPPSSTSAQPVPPPAPASADAYTVRDFKVTDMPLPDVARKLTAMTADAGKPGVPIEIQIPPGETPLTVTYGYPPYSGDLGNLIYHLSLVYPLRYEVRDEPDPAQWAARAPLVITQLSTAEIQLNKKAAQTRVTFDFHNTDIITALKSIQAQAAAKGFAFELDFDALKNYPLPVVSEQARGWSVQHALFSLCYLASLVPAQLEKFTGYRVAPGTPAQLHDRVSIRFGIATAVYKTDDGKAAANLEAALSPGKNVAKRTEGPSIVSPAYAWTYRGKQMGPLPGDISGSCFYQHAAGMQPGEVEPVPGAPLVYVHFLNTPVDPTHIKSDVTVFIKKPDGSVLRTLHGQFVAPSGAVVRLVPQGAPLLFDTPGDPGTKSSLTVLVQAGYVDNGHWENDLESGSFDLVSPANILQDVQLADADTPPAGAELAAAPRAPTNSADAPAPAKSDLLEAREDADARRVLVDQLKGKTDDQVVTTLEALGRGTPDIAELDKKIDAESAEMTSLLQDGFTPDHPRIASMTAEINALRKQRKELVAGLRRAMEIDLHMAEARAARLEKAAGGPLSPPPGPAAAPDLRKLLLDAQQDADARRVMVGQVEHLPDDELVATLAALGRTTPEIADADERIRAEETDITNLLNDGFTADHPRIVSMRAEVQAREADRRRLIDGLHRAMDIDLKMAESRVDLLKKQLDSAAPAR